MIDSCFFVTVSFCDFEGLLAVVLLFFAAKATITRPVTPPSSETFAIAKKSLPVSMSWLPHHALVLLVPHLNALLPLVLVKLVLVQNSESATYQIIRNHVREHDSRSAPEPEPVFYL